MLGAKERRLRRMEGYAAGRRAIKGNATHDALMEIRGKGQVFDIPRGMLDPKYCMGVRGCRNIQGFSILEWRGIRDGR